MHAISKRPCFLGFVLLLLAGCSEDNGPSDNRPRQAVSGSVTLDGQPVTQGTIQFQPIVEGTGGSPKPIASGYIKDGKYSIERGAGPSPGQYKVTISSHLPVAIDATQQPGPPPKLEPEKIPAQFNVKSKLTVEVKSDPVNKLDFDLKSN